MEDWLDWGSDNVNSIMDFINQNRQHLEHTDDYEPNKVYPSVALEASKRLFGQGKLFEETADERVPTLTGVLWIGGCCRVS